MTAKDEFFAAQMYMFHITGFPQQPGVLTRQAGAPRDARLDVWRTGRPTLSTFPALAPRVSR